MFDEQEYQEIVENPERFRQYLDEMRSEHPEIFPLEIDCGYRLYGIIKSSKLGIKIRRIQLLATKQIYQVRPSFAMPYMIGKTEQLEKPLYLRRFGVPFEALAYVFGKDPMYWYRATAALGRFSIVGTTVKDPDQMPEHLVADEKHTWLKKKRVYLPTTAAKDCILGVDVVKSCENQALKRGYQTFRDEALNLNPNYQPTTVNIDGWEATHLAWQSLFPSISFIACFLHLVLGIQRCCRRNQPFFSEITTRLWAVYKASTKRQFAQRLRRLFEWGEKLVDFDSVKEKLRSMKGKGPQLKTAYDFRDAYRTSNQIDRLMNYQDRILDDMQYFHGTIEAARLQMRAHALLWNFHPYGRRKLDGGSDFRSPFEALNGFSFNINWLHNLMLAGSLNGYRSVPHSYYKSG